MEPGHAPAEPPSARLPTDAAAAPPAAPEPAFADLVASCREQLSAGATVEACLATASASLLDLAADVAASGRTWAAAEEETYARHLLARCPTSGVSLFAVVWRQGQVSPVHDHGTWGVVAVARGALQEEAWSGGGHEPLRAAGARGLTRGGVASFTNRPEYIHRVRAEADSLSLHLYGAKVASYHIYDLDTGARTRVVASVPTSMT